jgi:hypothetical protein
LLNIIHEAYLLTLSSPIKPGAIHRLVGDPEYEIRLVEYVQLHEFLEESYNRGYLLGRGDIEARGLGIGRIIADALKKSFERTGYKPLTGLIASAITLSSALGYSLASKKDLEESLRRYASSILYASGPDDSLSLLGGLEAIGDSDLLLLLDKKNVTRRTIQLNSTSIGDMFDVLSELDTGFYLTSRKISLLTDLAVEISRAPTVISSVVEAYLHLANNRGLIDIFNIRKDHNFLKELARLDKIIDNRKDMNRLLGGVFTAVALAISRVGIRIPS